jgi:hypothetical protein
VQKAVVTYLSPTLRGMIGKSTVHIGEEISAGGPFGQNLWISH